MAWTDYRSGGQKEDMQDDTYKILSGLIIDAIMAGRVKDVRTLHSDLDSLYLMIWNRLGADRQAHYETKLEEVSTFLYGAHAEEGEVELAQLRDSEVFDALRTLLKDMMQDLDNLGILFKVRSDLDTLVTRSGNS